MNLLGRPGSFQNRWYRLSQDLEIEQQGPVVNVLHIELHPLVERNRIPPSDLPKAGNPRPYTEAPAKPVFVKQFEVSDGHGSWAHEAHISLKHIYQLRKFVNAGLAQVFSDRSNTWIVFDFEHRTREFVEVF